MIHSNEILYCPVEKNNKIKVLYDLLMWKKYYRSCINHVFVNNVLVKKIVSYYDKKFQYFINQSWKCIPKHKLLLGI